MKIKLIVPFTWLRLSKFHKMQIRTKIMSFNLKIHDQKPVKPI